MINIKFQDGKNEIYNEAGLQAQGTFAAGLDGGLNPKELLEASVGLCLSITLKKLLERDDMLLADTEIGIEVVARKHEGGENWFEHIDVNVSFPSNMDEAYKKKAMLIIERGCTISNTLKKEPIVELRETDK